MLDKGVAVFDASSSIGGGMLGNYAGLRSNSHGCAFFDAVKELGISVHDDKLDKKEEIPMADMKKIQVAVGAWHEANLSRHITSRVMTGSTVVGVTERPNGQYCIRYTRENGDAVHEVSAINVCVCMGGVPYTPSWVSEQVDPARLETAQDYFQGDRSLTGNRVAIVGFSHSAFSLGDLLSKKHPEAKVTFIRRPSSKAKARGMPRIYFPSTEAADELGYDYVDADVCPDTNRVHRFGGVRGDARDFALARGPHDVATVLDPSKYDHIITACGYNIKAPAMEDRSGRALVPVASDSGTVVDAEGLLFPEHQIYAFGIGAGLPPSRDTGGEPGCTRRADGIWVSFVRCS